MELDTFMETQFSDASSSAARAREDIEMNEALNNPYFFPQPSQHITHDQPLLMDQHLENDNLFCEPYLAIERQHQHSFSHQRQLSSSTQSTRSSGFRSSNGSILFQRPLRDSIASTNTTWSSYSEPSRQQSVAQAEHALSAYRGTSRPTSSAAVEQATRSLPSKRAAQRGAASQEKDSLASCVARTKRCRRSQKEPKYWCTSCKEPFGEKYDWKRHEETYQERFEVFECGLCDNLYFLGKDFIHHHQKAHRCKTCFDKGHAESAKTRREARTGWGCGFCIHFDDNWTERCNHVARHFEKDGMSISDWHHSTLIFSLLQRPRIQVEWNRLLESKRRLNPRFGWNHHDTGRVEGYPSSTPNAQLQDLLEYFTVDDDAAALARLAFEKGLLRSSSSQKELPRPPVPPKDFHLQSPTVSRNYDGDHESLDSFMGTIVEDELLPTGICELNFAALDDPFNASFNAFC